MWGLLFLYVEGGGIIERLLDTWWKPEADGACVQINFWVVTNWGGSGNGVLVQGAQRHCPAALLPNFLLLRAAKSGIMSTKTTLK